MGIFDRLFGRKIPAENPASKSPEQAVLVYLDFSSLPTAVRQEFDLATIEDKLIEIVEGQSLGEYDGNEIGVDDATLYMYGPDAERLFAGVEQALRNYPLCRGGRAVVRCGGPARLNEKSSFDVHWSNLNPEI